MDKYKAYKGDCTQIMRELPDSSVDIILTDPPYLYLKNQKLDKPFDEVVFFQETKRVLTKDGFIVLFGRGTSFYRWNTVLAGLGFTFKEEIIWNKIQCTSPLMAMNRVHETISIHTKGNGTINKVKVPYLEMKSHDINGLVNDMKRVRTVLGNPKRLQNVLEFLKNNGRNDRVEQKAFTKYNVTADERKKGDRCVDVMQSVEFGMNEKSIIRSDFTTEMNNKLGLRNGKCNDGDRACNVMQSVEFGMNEKSIIKQNRDHYSAIHPTQKPIRLLERLLALVLPKNNSGVTVLDPFAGSFSTGIATVNLGFFPILIELDEGYYEAGKNRIDDHIRGVDKKGMQMNLFANDLN